MVGIKAIERLNSDISRIESVIDTFYISEVIG